MKFLDLFAGVGGIRLGMEQAGHECVGWVEWDKFARQSYQAIHNVKGVWNASDIRTVRASELPRADCWCSGFPCQDISVAGKQKGFTAGKRSSLFFTVTGLIRDLEEKNRPSYLLIENVKNLLSINRGFDFLKLQIELDEIGYDVEWSVLDSAEVVPQHRERIFIVGHLRGRRTQQVFPIVQDDREVNRRADATNTLTTRYGEAQGSGSYVAESEPPKVKQVGNLMNTNILAGLRIRKLTPLECWRLQGFPDWAFTRAREAGLSDSQLYKQAGNSVTVPVIKAIAENMAFETFGECLK